MPKEDPITCRGCGQDLKKQDTINWCAGEIYHKRCAPKKDEQKKKIGWDSGDGPMPI